MVVADCPRCGDTVAISAGHVQVLADLTMQLWHRACWDAKDIPAAPVAAYEELPLVLPPSRRLMKSLMGVVAVSSVVAVGIAQWSWAEVAPPPPAEVAALDLAPKESVSIHAELLAHEALPTKPPHVETRMEAKYPVPLDARGEPLDEVYPTLHDWIHPVSASPEMVPTQQARLFGTPRIAIKVPRGECGSGHCGIDLDGPRGRAIVAVAAGVVVRVELHEMGLDGMSGRYVRIQHDDGTLTSYMHLDSVVDGLQAGDKVAAGEYIGTLGATATFSAPPHLHFSLELPVKDERGDLTNTYFIDPAPFLARASVIPVPDRRRAERPAF